MENRLCLFICENFECEVREVFKKEKYSNIDIISFPSNCGKPPLLASDVKTLIEKNSKGNSHSVFIGSSCLKKLKAELSSSDSYEIYLFEQCFELFLNKEILYYFYAQGCYIISPGWLEHFPERLNQFGFSSEDLPVFFNESNKKILFLDTGINKTAAKIIEKVSGQLKLPYETIAIGLDYCRLILKQIIQKWLEKVENIELSNKLAEITRDSASYLLIFDQLENIVKFEAENEIVNNVFSLVNLLFAPKSISFIPIKNSISDEPIHFNNSDEILSVSNQNDNTENNSFSIPVKYMQEKVGVFNVYQVAFPEYLAHYSDMSSVLSYVVGLAIANARKYQSIKDNEEKQKYYALKLEESNFSKDKFFSIIAHDLRGPFGSIVGLLNIFNDNYDNYDDEERRTLLNKTYQTSQNTFRLLENLLHWASSQTGRIPFKPVNMDLHIISNMVIEVLREQAKNKNIRLIQLINLNTMVFADEDMLTSIFRNLIANAIKFSFPGNDVIIKASTDNLFAYISVADTGVGIVEENLQKIFNISENIHTKGTAKEQGTGLGMILCKEFVEKQGGQIKVDSIVDKGTTINFTVPLAKKNIKLNSNSILYDK